jgi:hypothetical protein
VGSAAGTEDPEDDLALAPQPGEGRVDLGDFGLPHRLELLLDHPREVVSGAGMLRENAEEDVGKRHEKTISKLI